MKLKNRFEKQDTTINNVVSGGLNAAKNVNAQHVLKARDVLFKGYKFKPWGATKLAGKIGKAAGIVGLALQGLDMFFQWKRNRDLKQAKDQLKNSINDYFAQIFDLFKENDELQAINRKRHNSLSASLNNYYQYVCSINTNVEFVIEDD